MNLSTSQIATLKKLCDDRRDTALEEFRGLKLRSLTRSGARDIQEAIISDMAIYDREIAELTGILTVLESPAFGGAVKILDNGSDWQALYMDGRKVIEGHSLSNGNVLKALGFRYEFVDVPEEKGRAAFPDRLPNAMLNPEWVALDGKPHGIPICFQPDAYKEIKIGPPPKSS